MCSLDFVESSEAGVLSSCIDLEVRVDVCKSSYIHVNINRDEPLEFDIKESFQKELIDTLKKNKELVMGDICVSLFETESLLDKIPKNWIYIPTEKSDASNILKMTAEEITDLFVNYYRENICPEWLEPDRYFKDLSFSECAYSDLEILDRISWLDFETKDTPTVRITIDRISFIGGAAAKNDIFLQDKGIDYKKIVQAVRVRFNLAETPAKGYEYVLRECAEKYLINSCDGKMTIEEIITMAKKSSSASNFRANFKKFLFQNDIALSMTDGYCGGGGECYTTGGESGFNGGCFRIASRGLQLAFLGTSNGFNGYSLEGKKYKDNELWEACYSSLNQRLLS